MTARGGKPAQGQPVVDRALSLLAAFSATHRSLALHELSARAGMPASTALRLANRLVDWGALERREDGRYVIGLRLLEVASLAPRGHGLREVSLPIMGDLYEVTHQHVLLAVLDGDEALLVERLSARSAVPVLYRVGGRLPLHSTGVGLVLLAHADPRFQEQILSRRLTHEPEHEPVSPVALRRTLAEVRRTGQAVIRRRGALPLSVSVAAPVHDRQRKVAAALSIIVPDGSADPQTLGPAVRSAARAISRGLSGP